MTHPSNLDRYEAKKLLDGLGLEDPFIVADFSTPAALALSASLAVREAETTPFKRITSPVYAADQVHDSEVWTGQPNSPEWPLSF